MYKTEVTKKFPHLEERKGRVYDGDFVGACLDTRAQKSVCGSRQAMAYELIRRGSIHWGNRSIRFKFGEHIARSIGILHLKFPQDDLAHLNFKINIVEIAIPRIIGLDTLKPNALLINYATDTLE